MRPTLSIISLPIIVLTKSVVLSTVNAKVSGKKIVLTKAISEEPIRKCAILPEMLVKMAETPNAAEASRMNSRLLFRKSENFAVNADAKTEVAVVTDINAPNSIGA